MTTKRIPFINRELSWLEFNSRVLEEAQDNKNPLFERLKFLSIVSSNLDEFFMVRVASLKYQIMVGFNETDDAGMTPKQQMNEILKQSHDLVERQYDCFMNRVMPSLEKQGIVFVKPKDLTDEQREFIDIYYTRTIYPVITPMAVDKSRPFPLISNKSLNIALLLENNEKQGDEIFASVQIPSVLKRFVELPNNNDKNCFILLEDIIMMYIDKLFRGHKVITMDLFRVTRDADLDVDEEGAEDLLKAVEQSIRKRKWGSVVRLEIEKEMDHRLLDILKKELDVAQKAVFKIPGPLDLTFLMKFYSIDGYKNQKFVPFRARELKEFTSESSYFDVISKKDVILSHPYDTFDPVVQLVNEAADDEKVLAIKQTLYRVSGNSPIVAALARAAEKGKQITVLVELKARFDEENNIAWAKRLERAGCHVIYGLVGLKTHCKMLLIVRMEQDGVKRYVHLGTGNYNDVTAKLYTDIGLMTSNSYFGADASAVFNMLSGYSQLMKLYKMDIAPDTLKSRFLTLIKQEAENAKKGKRAKIVAKMNALVDNDVIKALYKASSAGVNIELVVRGICCLRPGIVGISENITVRSIVGRFLEHSRIYYFYNDGDELIYLSSADWMPRNLNRRVELLFPVNNKDIRNKVKQILNVTLSDNVKARILNSDGSYDKYNNKHSEPLNSQEYLMRYDLDYLVDSGDPSIERFIDLD